jgi:hypothetical protein
LTNAERALTRFLSSGHLLQADDSTGDDMRPSQLLSSGFVLSGRGDWSIVGAPWPYHEMGVVAWEID